MKKLKLYEISASLSCHATILAVSKADALKEVETWEHAWHETGELVSVDDVDMFDVRSLKATDWQDEAHCSTAAARKLLP
jgi:hypothetical protein